MTTKKTDPKKAKAVQKSRVQAGVAAGASVEKAAPKKALVKHLRRDIVRCSACGKDHKRMLFILRDRSTRGEYPYAGTCPLSGKQVLLKLGA